jgi:hypothetical protein
MLRQLRDKVAKFSMLGKAFLPIAIIVTAADETGWAAAMYIEGLRLRLEGSGHRGILKTEDVALFGGSFTAGLRDSRPISRLAPYPHGSGASYYLGRFARLALFHQSGKCLFGFRSAGISAVDVVVANATSDAFNHFPTFGRVIQFQLPF